MEQKDHRVPQIMVEPQERSNKEEYAKKLKSVINDTYIWYCPNCGAKMEVKNNV